MTQPQNLSEAFGVSHQDVANMMEEQAQAAFFDELAKIGCVPKTEQEAENLLAIGNKLAEMTDEDDDQSQAALIKHSAERLLGRDNMNAQEFENLRKNAWEAELEAASQDALTPEFALAGLLAREGRLAAQKQ